jgi:putative autoinducer-2 (AI-2) aldolase
MPDATGLLEARSTTEMTTPTQAQGGKWIKGADHLDWGMRNRLSRLIKADGRCQFLPIDHGYFQGPTRCLERPGETIRDLLPYADGLFVTRGVLRACVDPDVETPVILRVSGGPSVVGLDLADEVLTTSIDEIVRLGVSAVGLSVFVGTDYETQTIDNLAQLVNACEDVGVPVMAVTAVGKEMEKRTARYLALACRICAEMGAKVVKTYYCDEDFDKVVTGCPVPVVVAGGPKCETELEVLSFVHDALQKGAIGVNLGRNVWQAPHPVPTMAALNAVIHQNLTPRQAVELFKEMVEKEKPAQAKKTAKKGKKA